MFMYEKLKVLNTIQIVKHFFYFFKETEINGVHKTNEIVLIKMNERRKERKKIKALKQVEVA